MSQEERIKAKIKGILKHADSEQKDLFAELLLETYRKETRSRRIAIAIAITATLVLSVLAYTLLLCMTGHF